ncbi:MAG: hypothetical protein R3E68_00725 [Burkholderiaceae bacterium]
MKRIGRDCSLPAESDAPMIATVAGLVSARSRGRAAVAGRQPGRVFGQPVAHDIEITSLQCAGDRSRLAVPDRQAVDGNDRQDLLAGTAQESLVSEIQFAAIDLALLDRMSPGLVQLDDRVARDALQDVAGHARGDQPATADHEKAGDRRFGHLAGRRQHQCAVVTVGLGLQLGEPGVVIIGRRLHPGRTGVVAQARPRTDPQRQARFGRLGAFAWHRGDRIADRLGAGQQADRLDIDEQAHVHVVIGLVGPDHPADVVDQRLSIEGRLHAHQLHPGFQTLQVVVEPKEVQGPGLGHTVGAYALEDRGRISHGQRQRMNPRLPERHQFAVDQDRFSTPHLQTPSCVLPGGCPPRHSPGQPLSARSCSG